MSTLTNNIKRRYNIIIRVDFGSSMEQLNFYKVNFIGMVLKDPDFLTLS